MGDLQPVVDSVPVETKAEARGKPLKGEALYDCIIESMEEWYKVHNKTRGDLGFVDFIHESVAKVEGGQGYGRKMVKDNVSAMISKFNKNKDALNRSGHEGEAVHFENLYKRNKHA